MEVITNAANVSAVIEAIDAGIKNGTLELFDTLGEALSENVKNRIISADSGRWAAVSKWGQAKTNAVRALQGAENFVKFRATKTVLQVYGDTGAKWTLTQHDQGFENTNDDVGPDGRVTIDIVNPGPLGLGSGASQFSWIPSKTGTTPARKIWPTDPEVTVITLPIASRWLQIVVAKALQGGVLGTFA